MYDLEFVPLRLALFSNHGCSEGGPARWDQRTAPASAVGRRTQAAQRLSCARSEATRPVSCERARRRRGPRAYTPRADARAPRRRGRGPGADDQDAAAAPPASVAITALAAGARPQTGAQRGDPRAGRRAPRVGAADTGPLSVTMLDSGARRVHGGTRCQPPRRGRQGADKGHHHAAVDVAAPARPRDAKSVLAVRGARWGLSGVPSPRGLAVGSLLCVAGSSSPRKRGQFRDILRILS